MKKQQMKLQRADKIFSTWENLSSHVSCSFHFFILDLLFIIIIIFLSRQHPGRTQITQNMKNH